MLITLTRLIATAAGATALTAINAITARNRFPRREAHSRPVTSYAGVTPSPSRDRRQSRGGWT